MTKTTITKNIPQLRFPEFDSEWKNFQIQNISKKITDGTHGTPKVTKTGIPYITAIHVKDGFIDFDNSYFLNQKDHYHIYKRCNPEYGDLLMVNIGSGTATVARVTVDFEFSLKNVALIKPDENYVDSYFFSQIQREKSKRLKHQISSGGAQPFLSLKAIKKLKLKIPKIPEQQKIANFLTQVDKKIELLDKQQAALEEYKKGVMQKIFNQEIRFKIENEAGELVEPPEWEEKKLGDIFFSKKGKGISKSQLDDNGQYKCILYGELYTTYNEVISSIKSKTDFDDGILSKENDLLIPSSTTTTGIDLANVTALDIPNIRLGGDIIILRSKEKINNVFYAYYLSNYKRLDIARRAQGITIVHLYFSSIESIKIDLPSLDEQNKIANFLNAIDTKIEVVAERSLSHRKWKKGLLQKMFV